jgi:hypothetical protein
MSLMTRGWWLTFLLHQRHELFKRVPDRSWQRRLLILSPPLFPSSHIFEDKSFFCVTTRVMHFFSQSSLRMARTLKNCFWKFLENNARARPGVTKVFFNACVLAAVSDSWGFRFAENCSTFLLLLMGYAAAFKATSWSMIFLMWQRKKKVNKKGGKWYTRDLKRKGNWLNRNERKIIRLVIHNQSRIHYRHARLYYLRHYTYIHCWIFDL